VLKRTAVRKKEKVKISRDS